MGLFVVPGAGVTIAKASPLSKPGAYIYRFATLENIQRDTHASRPSQLNLLGDTGFLRAIDGETERTTRISSTRFRLAALGS